MQEKIQLLQQLAGSIAHEVRTPLSGLLLLTQEFDVALHTLLPIYQNTINNNRVESTISADSLYHLSEMAPRAKQYINSALCMIDMLLMNMRENVLTRNEEMKILSMADTVRLALKYFPFSENQISLVECHLMNDFVYQGQLELTQHILFNLLNNALYAIKEAKKGKIHIQLKQEGIYNQLIFRDTALGIAPEIQQRLFDRFHTTQSSDTGLGLRYKDALSGFLFFFTRCASYLITLRHATDFSIIL